MCCDRQASSPMRVSEVGTCLPFDLRITSGALAYLSVKSDPCKFVLRIRSHEPGVPPLPKGPVTLTGGPSMSFSFSFTAEMPPLYKSVPHNTRQELSFPCFNLRRHWVRGGLLTRKLQSLMGPGEAPALWPSQGAQGVPGFWWERCATWLCLSFHKCETDALFP